MPHPHPPEQHFRLHFARSRDFTMREEHLLYLSGLLTDKGTWEWSGGAGEFEAELRKLPSLATVKKKALDNTFTELTTLYALIVRENGTRRAAANAISLSQRQDLPEFFTDFLLYFEFPGGFVTAATALEYIQAGVRLKPGPYIARVLIEGNKLTEDGAAFGIDRKEVTWYVLNDLAVSRDGRSPKDTAELILHDREHGVDLNPPLYTADYGLPASVLDNHSDFNRYGRDCLSYLEFAGVLRKNEYNLRYYLRPNALKPLARLLGDNERFDGYDPFYGATDVTAADIAAVQPQWDRYANRFAEARLKAAAFDKLEPEDGLQQLETAEDLVAVPEPEVKASALELQFDTDVGGIAAHTTGIEGESIILQHEALKLRQHGREDLAKQIRKIPDHFGVGYDIKSFDVLGKHRYIEVKTTKSHHPTAINRFHLTTNEWRAAEELRDSYFVYRLQLSETGGATLSILNNPVGLYKSDEVNMVPRDGADVSFDPTLAAGEALLVAA